MPYTIRISHDASSAEQAVSCSVTAFNEDSNRHLSSLTLQSHSVPVVLHEQKEEVEEEEVPYPPLHYQNTDNNYSANQNAVTSTIKNIQSVVIPAGKTSSLPYFFLTSSSLTIELAQHQFNESASAANKSKNNNNKDTDVKPLLPTFTSFEQMMQYDHKTDMSTKKNKNKNNNNNTKTLNRLRKRRRRKA